MLIKILVFVLAIFIVIISIQPSNFLITRSTTISAPPAAVFAKVNDLHQWEAWSPWAKLVPSAKSAYEGAAAGVGAVMSWDGNNQVGTGRMTIVESHPADLVRLKLEFFKPFKAANAAEFTFRPEGNGTVVTWSMSGHNNFIGKAMSLVMNCDKMVGGQFEKGLASMKAVTETPTK